MTTQAINTTRISCSRVQGCCFFFVRVVIGKLGFVWKPFDFWGRHTSQRCTRPAQIHHTAAPFSENIPESRRTDMKFLERARGVYVTVLLFRLTYRQTNIQTGSQGKGQAKAEQRPSQGQGKAKQTIKQTINRTTEAKPNNKQTQQSKHKQNHSIRNMTSTANYTMMREQNNTWLVMQG